MNPSSGSDRGGPPAGGHGAPTVGRVSNDYDDFDETDVDEQQQEAQPQASTSEPAEEP